MLIRFIYDTSSFSDRLAQLAVVSSTKPAPKESHETITEPTNAETAKKGKDEKSTGK